MRKTRRMSAPTKDGLRNALTLARSQARRAEEVNIRLMLLNQQLRAALIVSLDLPQRPLAASTYIPVASGA